MYGASKRKADRERRRRKSLSEPKRGFWALLERNRIKLEVFAVFVLIVQLVVWSVELSDRREARKVAAWQVLKARASGNSDKGEALEYLHSRNEPLRGIDLSCETHFGGWDAMNNTCKRPVYLRSLALPSADLVSANLGGADLRDANLNSADLQGVNLRGADLQRASLRGVRFAGANLSGARLRSADLSGAHLVYINLSRADLSFADLSGADLRSADLSSAHLLGAILVRADLGSANISGTDLSVVQISGADTSGVSYGDGLRAGSLPPFACEGNGPTNWPNMLPIVIVKGGEPLFAAYELAVAGDEMLLKRIQERPELIGLKKWDDADVFPCK